MVHVGLACTKAESAREVKIPTGHFEVSPTAALEYPTRLAVGVDGTVYVADTLANRVVGFRDGRAVMELVGLDEPLGLAVGGSLLVVGNHGRRNVEVYDLAARRPVLMLGAGEGEIEMPNAVALGAAGAIYVVDSREDEVKVFSGDGQVQRRIGAPGTGRGHLRFPVAVAVGGGRVVVADQGNHRLQVFDETGRWLKTIGEEVPAEAVSLADYRGRFTRVQALALRGEEILALDSFHRHVQVFTTDGASKGFFGHAGHCESCVGLALDIAIGPAGEVVATDPERQRWVTLVGSRSGEELR